MDIRTLRLFCQTMEAIPLYYQEDDFALRALLEAMSPLEEFLGCRLFLLDRNKLEATEGAKTFYPFARDIINNLEEGRKAVAGSRQGQAVLLVGACSGSGNSFMVSTLARYKKTHPENRLLLRIDNSTAIIEKVHKGVFELGITGYRLDQADLEYQEILEDELVLIVPPDHALAQRKNLRLQEILEEPFIMEQQGSGSREALLAELSRHGIEPSRLKVVMEVGLHESVKAAVLSGLGISILPWLSVCKEVDSGKIVALRFQDCRLTRRFYLVTRGHAQLSPKARSFYQFILKQMDKHDE